MYRRPYITTARDRRLRQSRRMSETMNPSQSRSQGHVSQPPPRPSTPSQPVPNLPSMSLENIVNFPNAHSTEMAPTNLYNNDQTENSGSEMSVIEEERGSVQIVSRDNRNGTVDIRYGENNAQANNLDFWSVQPNRDESIYLDLPNSRGESRGHPTQTNPFLPGYNEQDQYVGVAGSVPNVGVNRENWMTSNPGRGQYKLMPCNNQGFWGANDLTKTDRMVLLELIKNVGVTDGSDEVQLIRFLKDLKPLFDIAPACSDQVIKLLIPKTKGQLFKLWVEGTTAGVNWDDLHGAILNYFLPTCRLRELETVELDRAQRQGESFVEYVENVIGAAFALKTNRTEEEVIETILCKCDPAVKVHFAFCQKPRNISELKRLANSVTGALKTESRYFGGAVSVSQRNVRFASATSYARQNSQNYSNQRVNHHERDMRNERVVRCYKCNGEGHIARNCRTVNY